ncbi:MAG: hypothetical protein A3K19_24800 [Lentisphaerae bacterium RIFOXYB12_FULL_65_16]|nr:MAG: hypothetical protein A3K18_24215 [Lentisphaerae bacterium RIFOXYA12_64_32]OGV90691.1 MAG: hypothetical protein A3K19_24800 [Lentisphaerae bacterium RIFOXYB12_FULL_65_16]
MKNNLSFRNGSLVLETPWAQPALGRILINDEAAAGRWTGSAKAGFATRCGAWRLTVRQTAKGAFQFAIANADSAARRLNTVRVEWGPAAFGNALNTADFRELVFGGSFRSLDSGAKPVGRKVPCLDFVPRNSMLSVYQADAGGALLLGVLPPVGEAFSEFTTLHSHPHFEGTFGVEAKFVFECLVEPGKALETAPLLALAGTQGTDLMLKYGALWKTALGNDKLRRPMIGWNSWDYYAGAVTRDDMDENLAAGKKLFGKPFQVVCIDEGWEQQWGAWDANAKFSEGLADFCRHVRKAGCMPGVWTAPLLVNTYNPLFLEHPDWFAARADGQLQSDPYSYGPMAYLDVTRPEVIAHLKSIFARLKKAGFGYFKVDFSHCILNAVRFHDPHVGRNGLIRRAFQAIRDAIGPDAYLLSCGSPYESVVGLVDAVRTTGDIHIFWGHIVRNAGPLSARWWMQGNLWNCDPDFLVVRGPDTARDPIAKRQVVSPTGLEPGWVSGRVFNEMEARTYALLVHLSGGDVFTGDVLKRLKPNGVDMLRRVLVPRPAAAVPVDLFTTEQDLPRVWIGRGDKDVLVGLFNWSDKPARLVFDPAQYGLTGAPRDFWTGKPAGPLPERLPRRSSLALVYPV